MKIIKILSVILLAAFVFSGCNASQSLSDLTIVEAVGIDYEKSQTKVSFQYLNLSKSGGTTDAMTNGITSVAYGKANGISNAIASASSELSQEIFFGQNKIIVIGKEYVEYGIENSLDYLLRSVDSRPDVIVAMTDDKAEKVIKSKERDARIPAESLYSLMKNGENNGFSAMVSVNDMLNYYADETTDLYLPVISVKDSHCVCKGIAIFSKEDYVKTLNKNQTLGFLIMKNKIKDGLLNVKDKKLGDVSVEILSSKAEKSIKVTPNGYEFVCEIKLDFTLDEVENGVTTAIKGEEIKQVESLVNSRIKKICTSAFNECIKSKSDCLMLGRYLALSDSKKYNSVKKNWRNELDKIKINVSVKSNLEKVNDTALRG